MTGSEARLQELTKMNKKKNELLTKLEIQTLSCVVFTVSFPRKGETKPCLQQILALLFTFFVLVICLAFSLLFRCSSGMLK
jgi:hypothetical protein